MTNMTLLMTSGRSQPSGLATVQLIRKAVLFIAMLIVLCLMSVTASAWERESIPHRAIKWIGLFLMLMCVAGRTWCSMYIGGRKSREFTYEGPYSVSRNPLYFFTFLGAAGMATQDGSATLGVIAALITWLVFRIVVQKEEEALSSIFGQPYQEYLRNVPRFLPKPELFHDLEVVQIRPKNVWQTFLDAAVFLLALPALRAIEYLQHIELLPVLFRLP